MRPLLLAALQVSITQTRIDMCLLDRDNDGFLTPEASGCLLYPLILWCTGQHLSHKHALQPSPSRPSVCPFL